MPSGPIWPVAAAVANVASHDATARQGAGVADAARVAPRGSWRPRRDSRGEARETQHKFEVNTRARSAPMPSLCSSRRSPGVIFLQWSGRFPLWLRVATCSHVVWALWSWAQSRRGPPGIWLYEGLRLLALVPLGLVMPESLRLVWVGFSSSRGPRWPALPACAAHGARYRPIDSGGRSAIRRPA